MAQSTCRAVLLYVLPTEDLLIDCQHHQIHISSLIAQKRLRRHLTALVDGRQQQEQREQQRQRQLHCPDGQ